MNLRTLAFVALTLGAGLMFGGTFDDVTPVDFVAEASACEDPRKGCGSCWVDPGDPQGGVLPHIECHN